MNQMIVFSLIVIFLGIIGYYIAYYKGKRAFAEQAFLYEDGVKLNISNAQELYAKILQIHYAGIKNVWIEDGNRVFVQGQKREHAYYVEDSLVKMEYPYSMKNLYGGMFRSLKQMSIHKDVKAMVEANQIMDAIIVSIGSDEVQPYNVNYRGATMGAKILWPSFLAIIFGGIILCFGIMQGMHDEYIGYIKQKNPLQSSDATFDDVFSYCMKDAEWEYFQSDQGEFIVEISGHNSMDGGKYIIMQFVFMDVNEESEISSYTDARISYMEIGGVACSSEEVLNYITWMANVYVESAGNVIDNGV